MDNNTVAIDIGGSSIKGALIQDGKITASAKTKTPKYKPAVFLEALYGLIDEISAHVKITKIGVGVCGMVKNGVLLNAVNLALEGIDIASALNQKYSCPVRVQNDVACFAVAEAYNNMNTTKLDETSLVYIAIGTGINVGVVMNGRLLEGIEYGHTTLLDGTVEKYLSIRGLEKYKLEKFLSALEIVLVNIANTYRPKNIFIGGGLSANVAPHIDRLNEYLKEHHYGYKNAPVINVQISTVQFDGAILGAALI